MEYQSLITIVPWTFIAQILNLLLQAYLFKRFLFKPVQNIIAKRKAEIDSLYTDAEDAKKSALEDKSAYAQKLSDAQNTADGVVTRATQNAQAQSDAILTSARQEAAAIKVKAADDIELERKKAVNEMKNELSSMAVAIAAKVTEKEITEKDNEALIEKFIEGLGEDK